MDENHSSNCRPDGDATDLHKLARELRHRNATLEKALQTLRGDAKRAHMHRMSADSVLWVCNRALEREPNF